MEKTRSMEVEILDRARIVYDRYEWLKAKLLTRYNVYYDSTTNIEEIMMINEWYEETKAYLEKRFVREFSKAVAEKEVLA